ncbi:MAG: cysteine--tRNA ligase [Hyphomicrobiales bacterium]|nr:cysteine--tRNA ligase [Hyphomicrobiales bacterium]
MIEVPQLKFYNTLTRKKEIFQPMDPRNVRLYVCGPTVYDFAHIGNARPVIVFDILYRLLSKIYGKDHVTYVRNITDVDDKINARALRDFPQLPLNDAIGKVTEKTTRQYNKDVKALGCLEPNFEPKATEHIDGMITMIETLIKKGNAYTAQGEVLFDVSSMPGYGQLSNRKLEDQQAGVRVAISSHKKNPGDFVLWKLSSEDEPGWPSPWGIGRPGWHIECSVMSKHHLGQVFDIHGGGLDLIFPHHENEIAQSRCAHGQEKMANVWMHNGFLQLEGKKMSKSDGNFITINELLETDKFGGRKWPGEVLKLAMLMTHYREPVDFSVSRLEEALVTLESWLGEDALRGKPEAGEVPESIIASLSDDLNFNKCKTVIAEMVKWRKSPDNNNSRKTANDLAAVLVWLGLAGDENFADVGQQSQAQRDVLRAKEAGLDLREIETQISARLEHIGIHDWAAADAIRQTLLDINVQLKDSKDAKTGERITTWELKR